jgi:hypothetical protein
VVQGVAPRAGRQLGVMPVLQHGSVVALKGGDAVRRDEAVARGVPALKNSRTGSEPSAPSIGDSKRSSRTGPGSLRQPAAVRLVMSPACDPDETACYRFRYHLGSPVSDAGDTEALFAGASLMGRAGFEPATLGLKAPVRRIGPPRCSGKFPAKGG